MRPLLLPAPALFVLSQVTHGPAKLLKQPSPMAGDKIAAEAAVVVEKLKLKQPPDGFQAGVCEGRMGLRIRVKESYVALQDAQVQGRAEVQLHCNTRFKCRDACELVCNG